MSPLSIAVTTALTVLAGFVLITNGQSFSNPVLDYTSADPYIYLHTDGFYYFVISRDRGIVLLKNDKLSNWRNPVDQKKVYSIPEGNENLWAPEVHFIEGQWYIYFTMGTGPIPTQRMHVIQALDSSNPLGEYSNETRLVPPAEDYYQIDGTVIQYGNGTNLYMMWSGCDRDGIDNPTELYIAPMSNPSTVSGPRVLLRTRTQDWEGTVLEGPQVIWSGNGTRLIIVFSANDYQSVDYCLGMMGIDDLKDPLVPSNWWNVSDGPVFYKNDPEGVYGPGHASFTYSPDQTEGWIVYHAMQTQGMILGGDNRTTRVQKYDWSPEGLPVLPRPLGFGRQLPVPSGEKLSSGSYPLKSNTFQILLNVSIFLLCCRLF